MERALWGDPVSAMLMRRIAQGQLEGKPFDVSSLALAVRIPAPTVSRRVVLLMKDDWVRRQRSGRSYRLLITSKACTAVAPHLPELRRSAQRFKLDTDDLA